MWLEHRDEKERSLISWDNTVSLGPGGLEVVVGMLEPAEAAWLIVPPWMLHSRYVTGPHRLRWRV